MKLALLILILAAITAYACSHRRRPPIAVDLDGIAEVHLPPDLRLDSRDTELTGDQATFHFRRVNDTHLNGQTSYAELLTLSLLAEDLPVTEAFEIKDTIYERHPVKEPAWRIRFTDPKAGVALDWQGYKKHYTSEKAKAYVLQVRDSLHWKLDRAVYFQSHRDWSTANWPAVFQNNVQLLNAALSAIHFPPAEQGSWVTHQNWRYIIDNERPRRFHLVRVIANIKLPEGPFRILAPLTFFRFFSTRNFWHQENQGHGGGTLPVSIVPSFLPELSNQEHVYFYRIQSLLLWKEHPSIADALRDLIQEANHRAEEFHKQGAIDADAIP